ncbi:MAG TPA: RNA-protein complex protein Nop10 [Candidatus Thermoplasmatota archaeon]|nr:RNA-protein complex protein Nop10 [Candidatus Thermoplasmatota archaeon]
MRRCTQCQEYTLQDACPRCGGKAKPNRPAKFSPEDQYGEYRRKLKRLDQGEKAEAALAEDAAKGPKKDG